MTVQNNVSVERQNKNDALVKINDTLVPPVDIYEDSDTVTLLADLPGVSKDGLDVHIDKDTLEIFGKSISDAKLDHEPYFTELPIKNYYRAFTIGEEIDREKIAAHLSNGVLKVVLHKMERAKPKKIEIKYC